ncbi:transcriptional regulatory [Fusarium mexicanum]|uniref:Transcriptional regulatory n=1 Tax=Fusarium mexicanum TaxID=751941 RepID=A0A8H5JBJ1_9HYPO|nr:transcriptional regulatory [Fusarium mexicanum]
MSDSNDDSDGPESRRKRIRQACLNCRKKKVRCTGEKPICQFCNRLGQPCVYAEDGRSLRRTNLAVQPALGDVPEAIMDNITLRFASLEDQISTLQATVERLLPLVTSQQPPSKRTHYQANTPGPVLLQTPSTIQSNASERPQPSSLLFAADVYFRYCHSQPYSLFHEPTFRQRLADDTLPTYLLWGFLSAARRYSSLPVTQVNCSDDASSYAAKAWETIELPWTGNAPAEKILTVIQTIILIVSTEVPAGLCTQAHMKQGFAIRLAQNNKFHLEPDPSLPAAEREERRRTFWSLYLQDKLISLSRGRFSAIRDEECKVSLPCSEDAFKEGREEKTPFLDELTGDCVEQEAIDGCCPLGLINVMASILGRVSHYVLHDTQTSQLGLPWSSTGPYATLSSALLQAEHYFGMNEDPLESLKQRCTVDGVVDQLLAGSFIFAKAMFHLSHCLLHHPFLIQQRLQSGKQKAPSVFMKTAWEKCRTHAKSITDLLDMKNQNVPILTSIYGYCIMVAGTIHALSLNDDRDHIRKESQRHYRAAMQLLQDLSCYWNHAALMVKRLERFHSQCESRGQELSPSNVERTPGDVKALWQSVDYTSLSTPTRPGSPTLAGQTSVEADWGLSTDMFDFSGFGGFAEGVDVFSISFVDGDMTLGDEIPNMVQNWTAPEKAD